MESLHGPDHPADSSGADVRISVRVKGSNPSRAAQHFGNPPAEPGATAGVAESKRVTCLKDARPGATARRNAAFGSLQLALTG
jgi:hypothetical protein